MFLFVGHEELKVGLLLLDARVIKGHDKRDDQGHPEHHVVSNTDHVCKRNNIHLETIRGEIYLVRYVIPLQSVHILTKRNLVLQNDFILRF